MTRLTLSLPMARAFRAVAEGFANVAEFMAYFGTLHRGPIDLTLPVWAISFEVTP